jgi:hypothetical protein
MLALPMLICFHSSWSSSTDSRGWDPPDPVAKVLWSDKHVSLVYALGQDNALETGVHS